MKRKVIINSLIIFVLAIGVAYAFLNTDLTMTNNVTLNSYESSLFGEFACIKAETLHQEECDLTSKGCIDDGYQRGNMITYGHTTGNSLTSGYALDCDLNGNGKVDKVNGVSTERFYYVSDLYTGTISGVNQFNSDYAVLIYYKSIDTGTSGVQYYYENNAKENWHGPVTLLSYLPSRSTWTNTKIGLTSTSRTIVNEEGGLTTSGGTIDNPFVYTDKVARLLTAQEMSSGCGVTIGNFDNGELSNCKYMMEDTCYSKGDGWSGNRDQYWLENPVSFFNNDGLSVDGSDRRVGTYGTEGVNGLRPVIEVSKANISLN